MGLAEVLLTAGAQYGCFTRDQVSQVLTKRQLEHLLLNGVVERCWTGVYVVAGTPARWHQRAMAALLSVPGAALSHRSAARFFGLTFVADERLHITAPGDTHPVRPGLTVHRSIQLEPFVCLVDGFRVTTVARTLVDLSSCLTVPQLGAVVDQACNLKLVELAEIRHCLDEMVTVGRSLVSSMREVLAVRNVNDERLDSFLERRALKWIREAGLPEPVVQERLMINGSCYRPDIQYPQHKIAVEPGGPHHLLPSVASYDRPIPSVGVSRPSRVHQTPSLVGILPRATEGPPAPESPQYEPERSHLEMEVQVGLVAKLRIAPFHLFVGHWTIRP